MAGLRINELLANGYFKTKSAGGSQSPVSSARTPSSSQPTFLSPSVKPAYRDPSRERERAREGSRERSRSRSRTPRPVYRGPPPPRPTVEDELVSLARESRETVRWPDYEVPCRGMVGQNPIILEADVGTVERDRLQEAEYPKERDGRRPETENEYDNLERRFVFIPKAESSGSEAEEKRRRRTRRTRRDTFSERPEDRPQARREELDYSYLGRSESKRDKSPRYGQSSEHGKYHNSQPVRPETMLRRDSRREERRKEEPASWKPGGIEPKTEDSSRPGLKRNSSTYGPQTPRPEATPRHDTRREETRRETARQDSPMEHRSERSHPQDSSGRDEKLEKPPRQELRREERPVQMPRQDSFRREDQQDSSRREAKVDQSHPPLERRRSRQDLPALETKVPREIPPQFRRSASGFATSPSQEATPKVTPTPRTPVGGDYFLSPDTVRANKDQARQQVHDALWAKTGSPTEKRNSGSYSGSRPGTPGSDTRSSGNEKLSRPQQFQEDSGLRRERQRSPDRGSNVSSRPSTNRNSYYSGSENDPADSDSEKIRRAYLGSARVETRPRAQSRSDRSSVELKPSRSSPLPSPKLSPTHVGRAETFPPTGRRNSPARPLSPHSDETPRADRLNHLEAARPSSRQSNDGSAAKRPSATYHGSLPLQIPSRIDSRSPGDGRSSPTALQPQETPRPGSWQPPAFQPSPYLDKPVGSYRRYSQDIERGSVAPLPTCSRTEPTRGRNDWLTLSQCRNFDICPTCYNSIIAPTEFRNEFIPARRSPDVGVKCDFGSSPWYRIAWLLTIKERRRDLNLLYGLEDISNKYPPCLGKREAVRQWHSVIDHKTGAPVRGFHVCYSCVKCVETLLPATRGVFIRTDNTSSPQVCDLRFDSKRFVQYFDALETAADRASYHNSAPDTRDLASLARRLTSFEECQRDKDLPDRRWHVITQLPEFTVCEECFDEVVWPELEEEKAIPLMFNKTLQRLPKASCQLYSAKMRGIFRLAVDSGDYKMLATKARERYSLEREVKAKAEMLRRGSGDAGVERDLRRLEDEWKRWG